MANMNRISGWTRRQFLRGAGIFGAGGAVGAFAGRSSNAAAFKGGGAQQTSAPAYDIEKFKKVDPKLLTHEQSATFRVPRGEPNRILFGPDEKLWLTCGKHVLAMEADGETLVDFSAGDLVRAFAVTADGVVWVALRDHVETFDRKGKRLARWDSPAKKAWLAGLAVTENEVFVTDAGNRAVYRFDRAGKLVGRIGDKDSGGKIPAWVVPSPYFDLEAGSDQLLWIVNPGQHQLQAFTFDGKLERSWGEASFGIAGFCGCCNPSYFTRLADGRFVTSEKGLPRVKVYSADGRFESVVAGPESFPQYLDNLNASPIAMDVAADSAGRIYVADTLRNEIRVFKRKS